MIDCGEVDLFKRPRRLPTKQLGYARVGSNPAVDVSPHISPRNSDWLECSLCKGKVTGSTPVGGI